MSVEDDTELRDLVAQTLEANGCLAKIRAQLRASIFLALDEDENLNKKEPLANNKIRSQLDTSEGKAMFCIVREFLEYFNLDYTISVFEPESYLGSKYEYEGRHNIVRELGITDLDENSPYPILLQLIQILRRGQWNPSLKIDLHNTNGIENDSEVENNTFNKQTSSISIVETDKSENGLLEVSSKLNLNATFNLSAPTIDISPVNDIGNNCSNKQELNTINEDSDDTSRDTPLIDLDMSLKNANAEKQCSSSDQMSETEFAPPILKDCKQSKSDSSAEKLKLSPQKTEKLKSKNTLSSLADLPPLQMNKSRVNDSMILPSLYTKEFKDKNNLKDIDKLLDLETMDNYEEDFMSGSEYDFSLKKSESAKLSLTEEKKSISEIDSRNGNTISTISDKYVSKKSERNDNSTKSEGHEANSAPTSVA